MTVNKARFTAIPAARSSAKVLRIRLFLVFTVLGITCLSGIFAGYSYLSFEPEYVDVYAAVPLARAEATVVAEAFMNGTMYSVSVTENMAATFAETKFTKIDKVGPIVWAGFERKNSIIPTVDTHTVEIHRFVYVRPITTVVDGQSFESVQQMTLHILMYIPLYVDVRFPPALAALPSIGSGEIFQVGETLDYSDKETSLSTEVVVKLEAWGKYWAEGNQAGLKEVSGDDDRESTRYAHLGGYTLDSLEVMGLVVGRGGTINVVRARLVLIGANGSILNTDMDVTVTKADTGLPEVVGWGPAGAGVLALEDVRLGG